MSMIKVTYSSDISNTVGVGGEIVKSASELGKQAATIFHMEYEAMKPPKGMTGIHLVALGDSEAYPMNRNGDLFSKEACEKYYPTFVKYGHVFEHHRNKDPKKSIGQIKAAAYNPDMHRVELYIWADNEKAHDHLERLEKTGEVPFSMACVRSGTPITTVDGLKAVEDIKVGDVVLTHLGNWRRVDRTMSRDVKEYCKVSFASWGDRVLEITPNHQVYAASFDDIPRGFRVDRSVHPNKNWKRRHRNVLPRYLKWIPAGSLTDQHYMCVPLWDDRPDGIGVKKARLYGYYIAEGSLCKNYTSFTCNVNDGFIEELKTIENWTSVTIRKHRSSKACVILDCFGADIQRDILQACGRRCENKRIPMSVRLGSVEEKLNFAAAWFNGDGWQDKNGIHWSIHPRNLANDLQELLASVGVSSSCTRIMHKEDRGIVKSKNAAEYVVSVSNEMSALFADISKAKETSIVGNTKMRTFVSGRYMFVPVKSVQTVKSNTKVYNFSVDEDESYTVYGLAVHNCKVPYDRCSICDAIRERPGDPEECDHIKYSLGKIAEDGRQIGTFNDKPTWFDISFVGRPADRIAWNLKVASAMPEDISVGNSVKQAEIEGYVLPDDLAIESDSAKRKLGIMKKLAESYEKLASWLSGETKPYGKSERYTFELRKLAGATLPDDALSMLREIAPSRAFAALGDAGVVMDATSFFKYAFGPEYGKVEQYVPHVAAMARNAICEAVKSASCAEFCNDSRYDAAKPGMFDRPAPYAIKEALCRSDAARGFGTDDAVTGILSAIASGNAPSFSPGHEKSAEGEVAAVAERLARKYAMYKLAALCAVLDGPSCAGRKEDEIVFVAAAQDMK